MIKTEPTPRELEAINFLHAMNLFDMANALAETSNKMFEQRMESFRIGTEFARPTNNQRKLLKNLEMIESSFRIFREFQLRQRRVEADLESPTKDLSAEAHP